MARLVAFGCSNTYGQALNDCYNKKNKSYGPQASKFAWPAILAKKLNLEVCNYGIPGASNKQIWNTVLDSKLYDTDIVVILWSHLDRYCFFNEKGIEKIIASNRKSKIRTAISTRAKLYYKFFHSDLDLKLDTFLRINHIHTYLKDLSITQYHLQCSGKDLIATGEIPWNKVNILYDIDFRKIRKNYPCALDNSHANEDAHYDFATQIEKYILNNK